MSYTKICFLSQIKSLDDLFITSVFAGINSSELLAMEEFGCCVCSLPGWDSTQDQN